MSDVVMLQCVMKVGKTCLENFKGQSMVQESEMRTYIFLVKPTVPKKGIPLL